MDYYNQETARFILRKFTMSDIPAWQEFFQYESALHYLPIDKEQSSSEMAKDWIERQLTRYANNEYGHLAVVAKDSGKLIASSGIAIHEVEGLKYHELGYSVIGKYWRQGIAIEVAQQIKNYAIANQISDKIISLIAEGNSASERVAMKNGMKWERKVEFKGLQANMWSYKLD